MLDMQRVWRVTARLNVRWPTCCTFLESRCPITRIPLAFNDISSLLKEKAMRLLISFLATRGNLIPRHKSNLVYTSVAKLLNRGNACHALTRMSCAHTHESRLGERMTFGILK